MTTTQMRAWRSYHDFEGRSSTRLWLYRIATNVCLTALDHYSRRLLPSGLGPPSDDPDRPLSVLEEGTWLQPLPGSMGDASDPAVIVGVRDSVRLALVAAVVRFLERNVLAGPGLARMVPTLANGQPAVAVYWRAHDGSYRPHAVQVLTITAAGISHVVSFNDPQLFPAFALADELAAGK